MRIAEEREEDDEAEELRAGNRISHERQKLHIFEQLGDMASQMKSFTADIESRLDKVYKEGATKKFGFDEITNLAEKEIVTDPHKKSESDTKINTIVN